MITLSEAIHNKYYKNYCGKSDQLLTLCIPQYPGRIPRTVILNGQNIKRAGNILALRKYCKNIQQLDISRNTVRNWREILAVLSVSPQLEFLNISFNVLIGSCPYIDNRQFTVLKCLVLNGTYLNWRVIGRLLEVVPALTELHLNCNGYKNVLLDVCEHNDHNKTLCCRNDLLNNDVLAYKLKTPYDKLKTLYFRKNPVKNWSDICQLGRVFPSLETLVLAECHLTHINCVRTFTHLKNLNLNDIACEQWDTIWQLAQFPAINNLYVRRWPLWATCELTKQQIWQLLILHLPDVEQLNGSRLSIKDREEAQQQHMSIGKLLL